MSLFSDEIGFVFSEFESVTASISGEDPTQQYKFTWSGTEYDAISVIEEQGNLFGPGGFTADGHLTVTARASIFTGDAVPEAEQFIFYKGKKFRIDIVKPSPDGSGLVFVCNDPDRGTGIVMREM